MSGPHPIHLNYELGNIPLLPELNPTGKLGEREVIHIPASHNNSLGGLRSKPSKIVNSVIAGVAVVMIIAGGIIHGTMNDACDHQRSDCNPTLRTAGIGLWAAGTTLLGTQCCVVSIWAIGAAFCKALS